jgi:hypothetical protein
MCPVQGTYLTRMLVDYNTGNPIYSGDKIYLTTDDPVLRPLPDLALLDIQWNLQRVTALTGVAEPQDISHNSDSSEDISSQVDVRAEDDPDMGFAAQFEQGQTE